MATNPIPHGLPESRAVSRDDFWELLLSLEGSMQGWFPEQGGASGMLQRDREDGDE